MKLIEAREHLYKLNLPAFTLQDVMGILKLGKSESSRLMHQLTKSNSIVKLKRGLWAWPTSDPLSLISYITAPFPCYVSLQTALFYHGIIEQIPAYTYAITLRRKKIVNTPLGTFSFHQVHVDFFIGFETHYNPYYQIATPEKAIVDYLYMSRTEPSLFGKLPEIDKDQLNITQMQKMLQSITHPGTRTFVKNKLSDIFK